MTTLRDLSGITQKQLAIALGVTEQTIRNWEQGRHEAKFSLAQIKLLGELLGIDLIADLPDRFCVRSYPSTDERHFAGNPDRQQLTLIDGN